MTTSRFRTWSLAAVLFAAVLISLGLAIAAGPAKASVPDWDLKRTGNVPAPSFETCANLKGWYVNEDEGDRKPTATVAGLKFSGNDLIHHAVTGLKMTDLTAGSFTASPAPDQNSFFSVEVRDTTGAYGTLRWNTATSAWDLVTNLGAFSHASAADFVGQATKWGELTATAQVVSFGVGYTNTPPGTVDTVVSKVTFGGKGYDLTCKPVIVRPTHPKPTHTKPTRPTPTCTTSAPTTGPTTSTPTTEPTTSAPTTQPTTEPTIEPTTVPTANPTTTPAGVQLTDVSNGSGTGLPLTGPPLALIAGGGVLLAGIGVAMLALTRRRRDQFQG